ncbi:ATP10 protein-domain-containing protein [Peziza echinospora]|nr:ATP10 protein-domain-containing protein [Peziza echinospora]
MSFLLPKTRRPILRALAGNAGPIRSPYSPPLLNPTTTSTSSVLPCIFCQTTRTPTSIRQLSFFRKPKTPSPPPPSIPPQSDPTPTSPIPQKDDKGRPDYTPTQLLLPLGLDHPPSPGENSGHDPRTLQQKRDDFVNWDRHLQKRKRLTAQFTTSYFQDFNSLSKEHKGKIWLAPQKLFRSDKALWFPNLVGRTLVPPRKLEHDLTSKICLGGKVNLVAVFSSLWGDMQSRSFTEHPRVQALLNTHHNTFHRIDVNVEQNPLKAFLIHLFVGSLRKAVPQERHSRYFIVRRGVTGALRERMGMMNARVGYVYLLDEDARIRWAGSGPADEEEVEALVRGAQKLIGEVEKEKAERHGGVTVIGKGGSPEGTLAAYTDSLSS